MNVKHVAATPIGLTITAKATLVEQDRKKLTFKIEAHDDAGLVGEATHERFIIESAPFLAKAEAKKLLLNKSISNYKEEVRRQLQVSEPLFCMHISFIEPMLLRA